MDDAADRGYSRAPELEDLVAICRSLNKEGVRYLLIGGFAVILHGLVRTTKDIDLLIDPSEENIRRLKRALGTLPDNAVALIADDDVRKYRVVRVADEVVVDLMAEACGISYEEAFAAGVEHRQLSDVTIPIAKKEVLIRMKDTIRDSDKSDVGFLRGLIEEERLKNKL
jgi:class 3 adenylate cyclase